MSADNWRQCLRCKANEEKRIARLEESTKSRYGKVTPEAWMAMVAKVEAEKKKEFEDTLREDYEFYIDDAGILHIVYSCSCQTCDFEFKLKETRDTGAKAEGKG